MIVPPVGPSGQPPPPLGPGAGRSHSRRWWWVGLSLAAVIAIVVGLLVWQVTSDGGGGSSQAGDDVDRTVGLLREKDPVCDEFGRHVDRLVEKQSQWPKTDDSLPASRWSPEQRRAFVAVGKAMSEAADEFEAMIPRARSVILQELLAQIVVYQRAYVLSIPHYVAKDAFLAGVASNFSNAISYMCAAIPWLPDSGGEKGAILSTVADPTALIDFVLGSALSCRELVDLVDSQDSALGGWSSGDATVPASQWDPRERALNRGVREIIDANLVKFRDLAEPARGGVFGDLLATHNAYAEAFADALPSYVPDDIKLWRAATAISGGIAAACEVHL